MSLKCLKTKSIQITVDFEVSYFGVCSWIERITCVYTNVPIDQWLRVNLTYLCFSINCNLEVSLIVSFIVLGNLNFEPLLSWNVFNVWKPEIEVRDTNNQSVCRFPI